MSDPIDAAIDAADDVLRLWHNERPVCPHCFAESEDAWEWADDSGERECGQCERSFFYERVVSVAYTTEKLTEAP